MPKVFYTEHDIEDMVKRGTFSLEINDNVVLTDLAYEKANRLGLKLISEKPEKPPAAPQRPYISRQAPQSQMEAVPGAGALPPAAANLAPANLATANLAERIHSAVLARLGNQVDPALLDAIIRRVLDSTGVK